MAITRTCPRCTHANTLDDALASESVQCQVCKFLMPAPASPPAKSPVVPVLEIAPPDLFKPGQPPRTKERRAGQQAPRFPRADDDHDDNDDARRRRVRRPAPSGGGAAIAVWLMGGCGVLLVLGCCGAGGLGYVFFRARAAEQAVVVAEAAEAEPPIIVNPLPGGFNPPPPAPPPPPQVRLDPKNPADLGKAMAMLKQNGEDFNEACRWFRNADVNIPQREAVALALEARLEEQKRQQFGHNDFFEAYFRWATQANFSSLLQMAQDGEFSRVQRRHQAFAALGRLKDARAAEPLLKRVAEIHDQWNATRALEDLGAAAQPTLVKHINDSNGTVRNTARDLLKKLNVGSDALLPQSLSDLNAPDEKVRTAALEMLGQIPVNEKQRPDVTKALNGLIKPRSVQGALLKALEVWGTADNAVPIADNLDPSSVFAFRDQVRLLVKFKDARTVPALTSNFGGPGLVGIEVRNALREFGKTAEPEVAKLLLSPDMRTRHEACRLLGEIGTAKISGPAMQRAVNAFPTDRFLDQLAKNSFKQIQARGN
jgi:HEAT repeat protein